MGARVLCNELYQVERHASNRKTCEQGNLETYQESEKIKYII